MAERALDDAGIDRTIDVLLHAGALTFGDLITKSGRPTPYFVNFGEIRNGSDLSALAECYADGIERIFGTGVDLLFGPAYKGIPLAVATALALHRRGVEVGFSFDRKEAKDHGEGGAIVGTQPADGHRVVILEDVTTAGTSLRAALPLLRGAADVDIVGVLVGLDRLECADVPTETALDGFGRTHGIKVAALVTIEDVASRLRSRGVSNEDVARIHTHLATYGVRPA